MLHDLETKINEQLEVKQESITKLIEGEEKCMKLIKRIEAANKKADAKMTKVVAAVQTTEETCMKGLDKVNTKFKEEIK